MKYQVGSTGRIVLAKFDDTDDVLGNLNDIAINEDIRSAVFWLVGGMREGKIVVGPETEDLPPKPVWKELGESHEVLGVGTIFWMDDKPRVHFHGAFGKKDMLKIGCLRENAETFLVLEAVIMEVEGVDAVREIDPAVGMPLLKLS